ncbi:MAG TPA: bifunctional 5,10-methylenetetrahydrofolate dehydrogenase/5,10-methenyltetrahydrofolate cyclohydrolase [Candidatus Paceibacterota bacterium]|jgi:methylenetetrahydrofolate dehydrogenase (NADP+)/methenyltetrahydrofolate cyclohydrolase|nr:bifunctional 5,10-methylenetetrahydrofolate dehydrogenase/5,10-methenyltetrahydrofolate cyclohydrolase [Candidatus Paceibacterota bacterium]
MIIDGKALAEQVYEELTARRAAFSRTPRLGIVVASKDPVIESFVAIKAQIAQRLKVELMRADLEAAAGTAGVITAVQRLVASADGIIVQLPLPDSVDVNAALSSIPDDKDVDAISTATDRHVVDAPVARAVALILQHAGVDLKGKRAVVVGAGRLVGVPAAALLKKLGAKVSMFTLEEGSIYDLKTADIVVCGAGNPGFIKPEHVKNGVALIDAGTSEQSGKVVGDCDSACADVASVFTPVPGGVGPIAVAMIFKNLFDLIEKKS